MISEVEDTYKVILFYRYVDIAHPEVLHAQLLTKCTELSLLGRILIASEGINGTLGGSVSNVDSFISYMREDERFEHVDWKDSFGHGEVPFLSLSIRVVSEIISSGKEFKKVYANNTYDETSFGGLGGTGQHLSPSDFHAALQQPNTVVLDIRNDFEHEVGHFKDSICIGTYTYAETFGKLEKVLQPPEQEDRRVLMYCTGGIRCEKASAYLVSKGYKDVCQLEGGIHKYMQQFSRDGLFEGKNFVFDSRVSMAPDGGEAANEGEAPGEKVGRCIDCQSPFDVYSGKVVCTVCRMPVLVCGSCREHNDCPEEYYCSRHRHLKGLYCTVVANYSTERLQQQRQGLEQLLGQTDGAGRTQAKRRTLRRQIAKIDEELARRKDCASEYSSSVCSDDTAGEASVISHPVASNPQTRGGWGFWKS